MTSNSIKANAYLIAGYHDNFYVESYESNITILNYEGNETHVIIPSTIAGDHITTISQFAFTKEQSLNVKVVEVPATVTNIENGAFHKDIIVIRYFHKDMEGFEYEGQWITDPYMDSTGRFSVIPLEYYGVKVYE